MENFLNEAFKRLSLLEDDFDITADKGKIDELKSFVADDIDETKEEEIFDVNAEDESELQATYAGKVILECECCHARRYIDKEDIVLSDGVANPEDECPVCQQKFGFLIIGKIEKVNDDDFKPAEEEVPDQEESEIVKTDDDEEDEQAYPDDDVREESLQFKLANRRVNESSEDSPLLGKVLLKNKSRLHESEDTPKLFTILKNMNKDLKEEADSPKLSAILKNIKSKLHEDSDEAQVDELEEVSVDITDDYLKDQIELKAEDSVEEDLDAHADGEDMISDINKADDGTVVLTSIPKSGTANDLVPLTDEEQEEIINDNKDYTEEGQIEDQGENIEQAQEEPAYGELVQQPEEEQGEETEEEPEEEGEVPNESLQLFSEHSFNKLTESFLHRVYSNVKSFNSTSCQLRDNGALIVEGVINYKSGVSRDTKFIFEKLIIKGNQIKMSGYNRTFAESKRSFTVSGKLVGGRRIISESLRYNYNVTKLNESNGTEVVKVSGKVVNK